MRRLFPSPVLSGALFVLWLLLAQAVDAGNLLLGAVLGVLGPQLTARLRPAPVRMRRPLVILRLVGAVLVDMLASNLAVARAILGRRPQALRSRFVRIPLAVRDPNALSVLAMIVTTVPGTAWAELSYDRSALLLHVLDVEDEAELIALIQRRYERPLREIFE
ncbi:Na+/H+ antiporter subunit E [Aggregicoccus sp. 17bor-14]|uniref:Na+/H+ antiporter subunit E n=1 Tax=Myxococcaceae TaxID=31 RepID=UPI00129C1FE9|nr:MULTISPECIES: Na+/H+ antiporter subunit E [Myxococcaceae]MBF5042890.1 Na+/H+ antiporter subunit E [Simulacricoccus sp. 17bor-14]MRI88657.1 Na+/H+ antiporter subunit E [Aggregicoccus sp. 17bor-14]